MMITIEDHHELAAAHAAARDHASLFAAVAAVLRRRVGFGLLTMLRLEPDGEQVQRLFTTDAIHYPLAGTEALGSTPWGDHVLRQGRPFLGPDRAGVRWAFPADCDLIESLGLGATMNVPIVALGRVLGSMNILDREHRYDDTHLAAACGLAPYLLAAFLE